MCGLRETTLCTSFKQRRADEKQMDWKEIWPRVSRQLLIFVHYSQKTPLISLFTNQSVPGTLSVSFPFCLFYSLSFISQSLIWSPLIFVLVVKEPWKAAWVSVSVFYLPLTACHQRLSSLASAISLVRHHSLCLHRGYSCMNTTVPTLVLTVLLNFKENIAASMFYSETSTLDVQ